MPRNRNRSAWVWVTIAAIALVSVAGAEGSRTNPKAGMRAALALLNRGQSLPLAAGPGMAQLASRVPGSRVSALLREQGIGSWLAILPVLFVAMVWPFKLLFTVSLPQSGRIPKPPLFPSSFQRPPPLPA